MGSYFFFIHDTNSTDSVCVVQVFMSYLKLLN